MPGLYYSLSLKSLAQCDISEQKRIDHSHLTMQKLITLSQSRFQSFVKSFLGQSGSEFLIGHKVETG